MTDKLEQIRLHDHRRDLGEALGLDDADAVYLWEDLLASVRGMVKIAAAAVAGLERPEDEYFNPWALRVVEEQATRLRQLEGQLDEAFGAGRWRCLADPIRALSGADDGIVARIMSGAMERAILAKMTPGHVRALAESVAPQACPVGWGQGFEAAASLFGQELLELAKAGDSATEHWTKIARASSASQVVMQLPRPDLGSSSLLGLDQADVCERDEFWADYAQRMRAANERALEAIRSRSDRSLADAEAMLSDALSGDGPTIDDEITHLDAWIESLQRRREQVIAGVAG